MTFSNGEEASATLVGVDESTDVAIIDVDVPAEKLTPLELGSSAGVDVGDPVVAIGSPFGLAGHASRPGIVSALDRTVDCAERLPDRRCDPDRRRHQSRQLRRTARRPTQGNIHRPQRTYAS